MFKKFVKIIMTRKMNTEKQPLLLHSSDASDTDHHPLTSVYSTSPPRPDIRNSPENLLVNVNSEFEDDSGGGGGGGGGDGGGGSGSGSSQTERSKESMQSDDPYNPGLHRNLQHPTSNLDTLIHLLKGNIGTGILAMPDAFKNAGLYVGLFGTLIMGAICTHCMHMLVKCAHELCRRMQVPSLSFAEVCYGAFETGPIGLKKYSQMAKQTINLFLCITQLGFCCVYFIFVALNLQAVIAHYYVKLDIRIYLVLMLLPMIGLNLLNNLKYLAPVSLTASIMTVTGLAITFHYMFQDLPHSDTVKSFSTWGQLPLYFGTAIYAFEGIGVILPLENNMKTPQDFGGYNGVLNTGMVIVACLYTAIGFFGYLKYGEGVRSSVTLNLPAGDILAQLVRIMMAFAIFLSYGLQFYVPINIIGPWFKNQFRTESSQRISDIILRIILVVFTFILATVIPNLGGIISLVGAVSSSTLALIFPPLIEIITFWPNELGKRYWILWKDLAIMLFGILGFIFGTYSSLEQIMNPDPDE